MRRSDSSEVIGIIDDGREEVGRTDDGGVVIDAMSFGKPVAATAAGGIPEAVSNGETGLLVPIGDATALGNAIARLLTDRALAE